MLQNNPINKERAIISQIYQYYQQLSKGIELNYNMF